MTSHTLVLLNCFEKPRRTYVSHLLKDLSVSMSNLSYYLFAVVHFLGSNCEQLSHHIYNVMFCFTLHWPYAWWPKRKKKKTKNCFQQNVFFFLTSENVCFYLYNHFFLFFVFESGDWRVDQLRLLLLRTLEELAHIYLTYERSHTRARAAMLNCSRENVIMPIMVHREHAVSWMTDWRLSYWSKSEMGVHETKVKNESSLGHR